MKDWIYEFSHKFTMMRCPVVHSLKLIDTLRQVHSTVVYVRECQVINRKEEEKNLYMMRAV